MNLKAPDLIMQGNTSFCPGCGHGIIGRLLFENIVEMGYEENSVTVVDVACCSLLMYSTNADFVGAAHGRVLPTASGVKRARKSNLVTAYHGDGAAYSIGMSHTVWSAIRNENITVIVVNNQVFGMTGGQMAPTTLEGQKTTSSPYKLYLKYSPNGNLLQFSILIFILFNAASHSFLAAILIPIIIFFIPFNLILYL